MHLVVHMTNGENPITLPTTMSQSGIDQQINELVHLISTVEDTLRKSATRDDHTVTRLGSLSCSASELARLIK